MSNATCPDCGSAMRVRSRFRFDHEPSDSERDTESLRLFAAMGIELGADVTMWICPGCQTTIGTFDYPEGTP